MRDTGHGAGMAADASGQIDDHVPFDLARGLGQRLGKFPVYVDKRCFGREAWAHGILTFQLLIRGDRGRHDTMIVRDVCIFA